MRLEFLAAFQYSRYETVGESVLFELSYHLVFDVVPEVMFHLFVDAFVADDSELMVFDGEVEQDAVARGSTIHL